VTLWHAAHHVLAIRSPFIKSWAEAGETAPATRQQARKIADRMS